MDPQKLAKFIRDSGLSYHQNSKSFIFTCPLCNSKDKLYIRKSDGRFACWKCRETKGFQGAPEFAFAELLNIPVKEARTLLYGYSSSVSAFLNIQLKDFLDDNEDVVEAVESDLTELTHPYHHLHIGESGTSKGVSYLESRGIPLDVAKFYKIRYSPEKQSVVFPSYVNGRLVGWQYRSTEKLTFLTENNVVVHGLKSLSSQDLPRDSTLMFQDHLQGLEHAVLCEGPIDAIKAHLVGGGVAALGKVITSSQVSLLLRMGLKRVYVALDPDAFAELGPLLNKFRDAIELYRVEIPKTNGKPDLGALSLEEAKDCILRSKPLLRNRIYIWLRPLSR